MRATDSTFHQLLEAVPDAIVVIDRHGQVMALNWNAEQCLGWTEGELRGDFVSRFLPARQPTAWMTGGNANCMATRRDGSEVPVELTWHPLGPGGDVPVVVTLRTIAPWPGGLEQPNGNDDLARATLASMGDAVITADVTGTVTYLNPVAERLTGWAAQAAVGQPLDTVLPLISETSRQPIENPVVRCVAEGRSIDLEDGVLLVRRDGSEVPIGDSAAPVRGRNGDTLGVVLIIQDESEKRRVGHRLSHEATHDALTGLLNRRGFERRLMRVVADLDGTPAEHVLLYLDLDGFKLVNDTWGHEAGDDLLRSLSDRFSRHMRKGDSLARLGGDEFAVLLEDCPLADARGLAESVRADVAQCGLEHKATIPSLGVSIGLVEVTAESGGVSALMQAVDAACYRAKRGGGNRVHGRRITQGVAERSQMMARQESRRAATADRGTG